MGPSSTPSQGSSAVAGIPMDMEISKSAPFKILIVDDEPDILGEVSECLAYEGFAWVSAGNARDALELVENDNDIGVVVTDIRMPGMDGLALSRELIGNYGVERGLVVIVVTGHAGMREAIEALQIGAEDFLTKPISPDHLLYSVRRAEEMVRLRYAERAFKERLKKEVKDKTADVRQLAADLEDRNRELEKKNKELTVVSRLKDEFLRMMSHELNTPLNAISGFAQLLQQNSTVREDRGLNSSVDHILAGADRLARTVKSILSLADITSGNLTLTYLSFSSDDILSQMESDFAAMECGPGASLHCERPEHPFDLHADFNQLQAATRQLVDNGLKHGGGKLVVRAFQDGGNASFSVSDSGAGMTGEQIAAAMEPLRQVDGSASRRAEGVGLGLTLAKGIAELHGGRLTIDSTPGEGTTVTISVPMTAPSGT